MTPLRQRVARILVQPSHATRLGLLSLFVHPFFALDERYGSVVPASSSPRYPCCSIKARFFYSGRHVFGGLCRVVDISLISNRNMSFYDFSFLCFFLSRLSRPFIWLMRRYKYFVYIVQSRFVYVLENFWSMIFESINGNIIMR